MTLLDLISENKAHCLFGFTFGLALGAACWMQWG